MLNYNYIDKQQDIPLIIAEAKKQRYLGLDTECTGLDVLNANTKLLLLQIEVAGKAFVIDARNLDISPLKEVLEDSNITKIIQVANYDYKILYVKRGISVTGMFDTFIAEALLQAGLESRGFGLENLTKKYLGLVMDKNTRASFVDFPDDADFTDEQIKYAALDVLVLPEIMRQQQIYLKRYEMTTIANLEFAIIEPVAHMELAGMKLDAEKWRNSLEKTKRTVFALSTELLQVLPDPSPPPPKPVRLKKDGTPFKNNAQPKPPPILNLDSWQQVSWAFGEVGIDLVRVNKITNKGLTNINTLKLAKSLYSDDKIKVKILNDFIKYRGVKQIEKSFGENLLAHIKDDGRIHSHFNQVGTKAGRFSASEPNAEQIPKKGEEGRILRACFIPAPNSKYIIADISQLHLRLAAELSNDPVMLQAFLSGDDIHTKTASLMFSVSTDSVTYVMRNAAKAVNFGIIYGMKEKTLSERLGCSLEEATDFMQKYSDTYPVLMHYIDTQGRLAVERGWSKTMLGRFRWFPPLDKNAKDYRRLVAFYERVGKNHPILGTDADLLKTAMLLLYKPLKSLGGVMINAIHDELLVEAPNETAVEAAKLVKQKMILAGQKFLKKVPMVVDVKIRDSWWRDDNVNDDELGQQLWLIPN